MEVSSISKSRDIKVSCILKRETKFKTINKGRVTRGTSEPYMMMIPRPYKTVSMNYYVYLAPGYFNKLSIMVKQSISIGKFKRRAKTFVPSRPEKFGILT